MYAVSGWLRSISARSSPSHTEPFFGFIDALQRFDEVLSQGPADGVSGFGCSELFGQRR